MDEAEQPLQGRRSSGARGHRSNVRAPQGVAGPLNSDAALAPGSVAVARRAARAARAGTATRAASGKGLLAAIVDSADDAIFAKSLDGTIMSWNPAAERLYGYSSAEMIGSSVTRLVPPDHADEIPRLLARVAAGEHIHHFETIRVAKDGSLLNISLTLSPIRDSRGHLVGASTVAREIISSCGAEIRAAAQRDLLDLVPAAVVGIDENDRVRVWNHGAAKVFGWTAQEVIGRPVPDEIKPLFGEEPTEVAIPRRDGTHANVVAAALPLRDSAGILLERVAIAIDVTEHHRAMAALRERDDAVRASDARYRAVFDQGVLPMATQRDGRIIDANRAFLGLFGFAATESLVDRPIVDLLTPEAQRTFLRMTSKGAERFEAVADYELVGIRADGTQFPFAVRRTPIELPDGRATLAYVRDLTVEKRNQAERDWLLAAVEQSAEMIILTDLEQRIVYANGAALRATGFELHEVAGSPITEFQSVMPGSSDSTAAGLALAAGEDWSGAVTYQPAGQDAIDAAVTISPVRDSSGNTVAVMILARDVTLERSLEGQLRQSQKMEAVGQLAGGIAHDFNNLLTGIRGYAELIKRGLPADDGPNRADIGEVILNADRAAELTRQLLAFSRRQILQPRVVDPADVVEGIAPLLRRLLGENIELRTSSREAVGRVLVDRSQLEQVIVNLALNARDAMPAGGELTLETDVVELDAEYARRHGDVIPGRHVIIAVVDSGSGMSAETTNHIFEPFFTTKGPGEGTGLGLATVYGIVHQSGGTIAVHSELDHGTSVKVYLPEVLGPPTPPAAEPSNESLPTGSERILLVEDEPAVRMFASRVLNELGYVVLQASRADVAIAIAASELDPIDLLVTDVVLPLVNGIELATQLAASRPELRVLFMSGYPERHLPATVNSLPDLAFLAKPFTAGGLAYAVRGALDQVVTGRPDA